MPLFKFKQDPIANSLFFIQADLSPIQSFLALPPPSRYMAGPIVQHISLAAE